jgi:hypothetical protein
MGREAVSNTLLMLRYIPNFAHNLRTGKADSVDEVVLLSIAIWPVVRLARRPPVVLRLGERHTKENSPSPKYMGKIEYH